VEATWKQLQLSKSVRSFVIKSNLTEGKVRSFERKSFNCPLISSLDEEINLRKSLLYLLRMAIESERVREAQVKGEKSCFASDSD
jgi:hypothetical protein